MASRDEVQRFHHTERTKRLPIHGHGIALHKIHGYFFAFVGRVARVHGELEHVGGRLVPRIFKDAALVADVQQIAVHAVGFFRADIDRYVVLLCVVHHRGARIEGPLAIRVAPGRNDLDIGLHGIGGQFETNLVVTLSSGTVRDGIGSVFTGDFNHALGDERARNGGAQHVPRFVNRAGAGHGIHKVTRGTRVSP